MRRARGDRLTDLLVAIRTVHFASTVLLAGTAVFGALVVGLVPRNAREDPQLAAWRSQTAGIAWASLATAFLSGAAWLVVLAADIGGG